MAVVKKCCEHQHLSWNYAHTKWKCFHCGATGKPEKIKIPETELAAAVIAWLESKEWEVYQEVKSGSKVADIVAVKDGVRWVIECKTSFSLDLLEQTYHWTRGCAELVSIAVPRKKSRRITNTRNIDSVILYHFGIGLIEFNCEYEKNKYIEEIAEPKLQEIFEHCAIMPQEVHKDYAPAGSAGGGHWTPFKQTCENLREYVRTHQGCKMKEAVEEISHHYSSNRSAAGCLRSMIASGVVVGMKVELIKNAYHVYCTEDEIGQQSLI